MKNTNIPPTSNVTDASRLLHQLRRMQNMTQEDISSRLHISRQTYSAYERGERPMPQELWLPLTHILPLPPTMMEVLCGQIQIQTQEEKNLLIGFRNLDEEGRQQVMKLLAFELSWIQPRNSSEGIPQTGAFTPRSPGSDE